MEKTDGIKVTMQLRGLTLAIELPTSHITVDEFVNEIFRPMLGAAGFHTETIDGALNGP